MTQLALPANPKSSACTGQACAERSECMRFMRPAWFPGKKGLDGKLITQKWASYDIEHAVLDTDGASCPHKLAIRTSMGRAMAQAVAA